MNKKLTLSIEQSLVEKAKKYASKKDRSLSDLIENYLKAVTTEENSNNFEDKLSPTLKSLKGSIKMPNHFDYKKDLSEHLSKKYLG